MKLPALVAAVPRLPGRASAPGPRGVATAQQVPDADLGDLVGSALNCVGENQFWCPCNDDPFRGRYQCCDLTAKPAHAHHCDCGSDNNCVFVP